jgi:PAS domain S-box-containing protein
MVAAEGCRSDPFGEFMNASWKGQFETLLNEAPLGVYLVDADMKIREVNSTARDAFGEIPDLIGRDVREIFRILWPAEYAHYVTERFQHTLLTGERFEHKEHIETRQDRGVRECYEWQINRIPSPDGRHGIICYFRDISTEVLAREAIAESEARFRMLAENVSQLFWGWDSRGQCDLLSRQWVDYTGIAEKEQFGLGWLELAIHPDDKERTHHAWMNAVNDRAPYDLEFRIKGGDGIHRWFKTRGTPIRDAAGTIVRWFGTSTEIDAQVRAEQALRLARDRFVTMLEKAPIVLFTLDRELRNTWLLNSFEGSESIIGKNDLEVAEEGGVISMEDAMALTEFKKRVLESGRGERLEQTFSVLGELKTYDTTLEPIRDAAGQVIGLAGVSLDISERKAAEEALRLEATKTRRLVDSNIIGVLFANYERIIDSNNAFLNMIGYSQDDLKAGLLRWREMTPTEHAAVDNKAVDELERFGVATPWQKEFLRKDGSRVPVLIGAAVFDLAPTWVAFVQDMSRIKDVENELRNTDRRKDEFLAMLAHELRNPLAAISNAVSVASRGGLKEHTDWAIEVINRQMKHLIRLIDDLLDVSRINQGKIDLRRDVLEISPVLDSALATVEPLVRARSHTLETSIDRGNLWVHADATRLEQVVVNLLNNAAKYSEDHGRIQLTARSDAGDVMITIADKGVGIPPEQLPHMFELFAQGDRTLARSEGGLGIGLTVVKRLVEMHGGSVTARSEGAGKGSEFAIRLPAAKKPTTASDHVHNHPVATAGSRILVVDDNVDMTESISRFLTIVGHDVAIAHSGPEAIEIARKHRPAMVLLDIGLPGMDGYAVAARLRAEECCERATFVAISGYGQEEDRMRSKNAGFDAHLIKPVDHEVLLALISGGRNGGPRAS